MNERELVIIGAGPAGYVSAIRASQLGLKVTVIEKGELGGTCLNIGCIPTKSLLSYADKIYDLKEPKLGITITNYEFNEEDIYSFKNTVVTKLNKGVEALFKSYGIELIKGTASFKSENIVTVEEQDIGFKNLLIATGSKAIIPKALYVEGFTVDSTYVLSKPMDAKKIVIIGGGVIGTELAFILNAMGKEITIVEKMKGLLITEDRDMVRPIETSLKKKGVRVLTDSSVEKIEQGKITLSNAEVLEAELCIVAVGRVPNIEKLDPNKAGIKTGTRGEIVVDNNFRTSNPKIYAVGDVVGSIQLAHYASACAISVVSELTGSKHSPNLDVVPRVTYSIPELASVGISEVEAKERGLEIKVGRFAYSGLGKALAINETEGSIKLIVNKEDKILGASVVGADAENLIAPFAIAMALDLNSSQLSSVIFAHPTLSELVLEVCEDVNGLCIHKAKRRG